MDLIYNDPDFCPLVEEKFDFDISLSPASSSRDEGEEDDVFVGPVTDKEKGICVAVECLAKDSASSGPSVGEELKWSPLTGDNFDRMCSEAHKLASQLKDHHQPHSGQTEGTVPAERQGHMTDDFVQETEAKLDMFSKPVNRVISPIKRETFCVQDSPAKLLPPAIQKRLLRGRVSTGTGSSVGVNPTRTRLSTSSGSSPAGSGSKTRTQQPKMTLRSKTGLGTGGILPSKLVGPATSSATSMKTANTAAVPAEKNTRMALPSKAGLSLRSKAPHLQTRGVVDGRRNSSSSSSSVSSLNSSISSYCSMSVSPPVGKGNLNTPLNRRRTVSSSRPTPTRPAPTNTSKPAANASAVKAAQTRRSTITSSRAAESKPAASKPAASKPAATAVTVKGARRSISLQSHKTSEVTDVTKVAGRSTPVKRAAPCTPTRFQQSPTKRASVSSVSSLPQFGHKAKPGALITPTATNRLKGPTPSDVFYSPDSLKMKPKRLMSASSMDSPTPEVFHTPSVSKIRRPSALPTPVNRRVSGIPCMTPKSVTGFCRPSTGISISARKTSNQSSTGVESSASEEELVVSPKIQPFSLERADPEAPQLETQNEDPTCVPQDPEVSEHPADENQDPDENQEPVPSGNLIKPPSAEEVIPEDHETKTQQDVEILLVDVPELPSSKPEAKPDKPLIDLSNTPDLIRPLRPVPLNLGGEKELIDLSSPLIKWSPEDKKENAVKEAALINLSF